MFKYIFHFVHFGRAILMDRVIRIGVLSARLLELGSHATV